VRIDLPLKLIAGADFQVLSMNEIRPDSGRCRTPGRRLRTHGLQFLREQEADWSSTTTLRLRRALQV
jgi:hypothetical protein